MSASPCRCGVTPRAIRAAVVTGMIAVSVLILPAPAQAGSQLKYVISVGRPSEKLASGTLWLYSYSWYGLQQYKLANIDNGLAVLPTDIDRLKREANPHPDTSAYLLAIQAGEHLWFRSRDIRPDVFWTDLLGAVRSLGTARELATGETQMVLDAPARRHVTFLDAEGRPKTDLDVRVSVYVWDQNHCAVHEGLPIGQFRTDSKGTVKFLAPLVPLYLDGLHYFAKAGDGPAGPAYSDNTGMKIAADQSVVVQAAWQVPEFTVQLRVLTLSGRPRPRVNVYGNWNTNTCGGADRIAETNASGIAGLDLSATFTALTLMIGGPYSAGDSRADKNTRELTDSELRELFSKRQLTIRW